MATLQKLGEDSKCLLKHAQTRIGRATDNEIVLEDETVSGYHALVTIRPATNGANGNDCIIEDLGSTNKMFVNNHQVARHVLKEGDIIRLGNTRLKFSTRQYVPPQTQFQQTQKLKLSKPPGYALLK
ncbi:MAG: FHA domain-containing protein [Gammaproteobacteria bacterium]|jgi:pSer/pThr/pTyr-binding forkhead associated (FHA) protein